VEWYSLGADLTENTISLLVWYHVFYCSDNAMPGARPRGNTASRSSLLLRDVTADVMCSSVACTIVLNADKLFTVP
jgi:hypothetical protein